MTDMRYDVPCCPECEEAADRRDEEIPAACNLAYDPATRSFGFTGSTDVLWDGQMVQENVDGTHTLRCPSDHEWRATPLDDEGQPSPDVPRPSLRALALVERLVAETRGCTDLADWVTNTGLLDEAAALIHPPETAAPEVGA